ncbi:hypothetical protein [Mucilaginibacter sp. SP1R1]|uniref:hypothetical protein n=1 Tax=Mucilaginibacter sp. SP1R1 TaxID=2723091 RepID=UPI001612C24E|nr:hypothetical protein [Mucilaginibacter sp. SP1R1]MBB6151742.1 hypothetical protein [Mucilaginibacter sp. SP1R1]
MKAVTRITNALFAKRANQGFTSSLNKVKEADQLTETIDKRLKEIQKKLKLKTR